MSTKVKCYWNHCTPGGESETTNGKRTSAQLWTGDVIAQIATVNMGSTNIILDEVREVMMSLPLTQMNAEMVLVPVLWKAAVFVGNNTLDADSIIKWRLGRNTANQTVSGTTPQNMQDPDTLVLDEWQKDTLGTSHSSTQFLWREYFFPKGLLIPRGKLFFMTDNQIGSPVSFEMGCQVQFTMLPVRSGELLQSVITRSQ